MQQQPFVQQLLQQQHGGPTEVTEKTPKPKTFKPKRLEFSDEQLTMINWYIDGNLERTKGSPYHPRNPEAYRQDLTQEIISGGADGHQMQNITRFYENAHKEVSTSDLLESRGAKLFFGM